VVNVQRQVSPPQVAILVFVPNASCFEDVFGATALGVTAADEEVAQVPGASTFEYPRREVAEEGFPALSCDSGNAKF
jgi:hypothetical protein